MTPQEKKILTDKIEQLRSQLKMLHNFYETNVSPSIIEETKYQISNTIDTIENTIGYI